MKHRILALLTVLALLVPGLALAEMLTLKKDRVNFRKQPSTKAPVAYAADRYYPVQVVSHKAGWVQVKDFEGETAWVHGQMLSKDKGVVVKVSKVNLRQEPNEKSKIVFTAARGAAFKLIKQQGSWLMVQHADGDRGWVARDMMWGF